VGATSVIRTILFVAGQDTNNPGLTVAHRVNMSNCNTLATISIANPNVYGISNGDIGGGVRIPVAQDGQVTVLKVLSNGDLALDYTVATGGAQNTVFSDFVPQPAPATPCSLCSN